MSCEGKHDHGSPPADGAKRSRSLAVLSAETVAPKQWRGLEELNATPEIIAAAKREFPAGASELREDGPDGGTSRRSFMGLLSASLALTGTACHRPLQKIVPYVHRPPEVNPGNSLHFATSFNLEGHSSGWLVESFTGRPTKIEGNPDHPDTLGASTVFEQAQLLNLYDDTRGRQIRHKGGFQSWREMLATIAKNGDALAADGGAKLRFLLEPNASPLLADLRARIAKRFPNAKFVSYSSVADDASIEGARVAFGRPLEARHTIANADVIVSLDSDFLNEGVEQIRLSRQFADRRDPQTTMNRLYVVEPCLTVTGSMADHRLRARGSDIVAVAQALAAEVARAGGDALSSVANLPRVGSAQVDQKWIAAAAKDLARVRGRGLVVAGRRQPAAVHALVHLINAALGNVGTTVEFFEPLVPDAARGPKALAGLAEEIAAGQVDTLVITAWNPVYASPADLKLGKLLERVPNAYYLGLHDDDTAGVVGTYIPSAHPLESWGDTRATDGTVAIVQPLIAPLWSSVSDADLLAAWVGQGDAGSHALLVEFWRGRSLAEKRATAMDFDGVWEGWLARGVIPGTAAAPAAVTASGGAAAALGPMLQGLSGGGGTEIAFVADSKVWDGRFSNNVWLQELPHAITKITWDNAILVSKATADQLGVKTGDRAKLELRGNAVEGAVYVQPGNADDSITVALGYGRKVTDDVGVVGFDANTLRSSASPWFDKGVSVTRVGGNYEFGVTQLHWSMEGREPAVAAKLEDFKKHDSDVNELLEQRRTANVTIHEPVDYSKQAYKWGMAIDLSKCTGCSACVVACQSENNIPVVGRHNVYVGREMQWIRVDRYYEGDVADPQVVTQPLMCMHCETAPCEYVCPVNATVHSDEGLNEMVYNRCIGTRYCSNNCPYKVRRFNFLDYHADQSVVNKMASNPDVTVRSRGVMEKCTYCVQRIERARIDSRVEGRAIATDEIQTACQQSCPTGAIVFGSLHDKNAKVTKLHEDHRRYNLLNELNTRPRTVYLARVRNPNPEL